MAHYKHLALVGKGGGKQVVVATVAQLQPFAQLLYTLGEIAHGDIGFSHLCHLFYIALGEAHNLHHLEFAPGELLYEGVGGV